MATKREQQIQALQGMGYSMDQINSAEQAIQQGQDAKKVVQDMNNQNLPTGNQTGTANQNQTQDTVKQEKPVDNQETLQTQKFETPANNQVVVKEGTAQQTGTPDYQLNSDARMKEITDNLNYYRQNNRDYFSDRQTFNSIFHYDERDASQQAVLDSYWKKKDLADSTVKYSTGESITQGLNNADITENQLNYIRDNSPEAYAQWQAAQEDMVKKIIANQNVPTVDEIVGKLTSYIDSLDLGSERYDFMKYNEELKQQYGIDQKLNALEGTISKMQSDKSRIDSIMSKYANAGANTAGGAAANTARMMKALAPYQESFAMNAQIYSSQLQSYQMSAAQVKQDLGVMYQQTQEDQRVFNNKLEALGFAMTVDSYRTPEQQMQLALQQQYYSNEIGLLNQSKQNDLSLYNQKQLNQLQLQHMYDTAETQNAINLDMSDLTVENEGQLRANLNNVLGQYYAKFGDIIERPQQQALQDILDYAQKNGVSVAEALRENFVKPLQNKSEYKSAVASAYGMNTSVGYDKITLNGKDYLIRNGQIVDPASLGIDGNGNTKPYNMVSLSAMQQGVASFASQYKKGQKVGQCGKFVNDYLVSIGVTDAKNRFYDNDLSTKLNSRNDNKAEPGSIAIFDFNHLSSDGINHGHVAIVTNVYEDGSFDVIESNFDGDEKVGTRHVEANSGSLKGFFNPSINSSSTQGYNVKDPYSGTSGYTSAGVAINAGGWIDSLETHFNGKPTVQDMKNILSDYGIDQTEYDSMKKRYMDYIETTQMVDQLLQVKAQAQSLLDWAQDDENKNLKGTMDIKIAQQGYASNAWQNFWTLDSTIESIQEGKALYDNLMSNAGFQKYLDMKNNGAQFGIMTDSEWRKVDSSVSPLKWEQKDALFIENIQNMINGYDEVLTKLGYDFGDTKKADNASQVNMGNTGSNTGTGLNNGALTRINNGKMEYSFDGGLTRY